MLPVPARDIGDQPKPIRPLTLATAEGFEMVPSTRTIPKPDCETTRRNFLTNVAPSVTADDRLVALRARELSALKVHRLSTRLPSYASFCILTSVANFEQMMDFIELRTGPNIDNFANGFEKRKPSIFPEHRSGLEVSSIHGGVEL